MTDIPPIGRTAAAYGQIKTAGNNGASQPQPSSRVIADSIEVSDTARLLSRLRALPEVRTDLINQAKANIESGAYDTDVVIEATIDKLVEDL